MSTRDLSWQDPKHLVIFQMDTGSPEEANKIWPHFDSKMQRQLPTKVAQEILTSFHVEERSNNSLFSPGRSYPGLLFWPSLCSVPHLLAWSSFFLWGNGKGIWEIEEGEETAAHVASFSRCLESGFCQEHRRFNHVCGWYVSLIHRLVWGHATSGNEDMPLKTSLKNNI